MSLIYKLYAYCEFVAPTPEDAPREQVECSQDYQNPVDAFFLGRTLATAGWRVCITEEDTTSGLTMAQFTSPDFIREEDPYGTTETPSIGTS